MSKGEMLIKNGWVVSPTETQSVDVLVRGDHVAALGQWGQFDDLQVGRTIDAVGKHVIPGGIDAHTHFGLKFLAYYSQSSAHGTVAAACGGTTTVIDFAVPQPGQTMIDSVRELRKRFDGASAIDYSCHIMPHTETLTHESIEEIGSLIEYGVPSIKTRTIDKGWQVDDGMYWGLLQQLAKHGGISVLHAEDHAICKFSTERLVRQGKTAWRYNVIARPPLAEKISVSRAVLLAEDTGAAVYILHMAAKEGVWEVGKARDRGLPIYGETLHLYLCFTEEALDRPDGLLWNNHPTIKYQDDQDSLWEGLRNSSLSTVATDDFTTIAELKMGTGNDLQAMRGGHNGVELRIPILYSEGVAKGRLSINRMVAVTATNPARIFGLYPRKGIIRPGSDADIVIMDPNARRTVRTKDLHADSDYSIYDGWSLHGYPVMTISRGKVVYENGEYVGSLSHGQFLERHIEPEVLKHAELGV